MNVDVRAPETGLVIGFTKNPLVRQGDALVHIATEFE
jgi:predicted deacylase